MEGWDRLPSDTRRRSGIQESIDDPTESESTAGISTRLSRRCRILRAERRYDPYWQSSTTQIESMVRLAGGTGRPRSAISLRMSSALSGREIADCTPTRTSPSE
jgi:hypothetical protein